ncbi:hypothetical protein POVWA2_041150 [Plasmodium ovale wallikeri]|uniref:Uncharacterized protein n=1 Tax=Plasmodium ovale wallikeri TaxID=864142 RepID=A0A1A8ZA29_PLAOA|nr:hypothetical protein POVWA1_042650 [Plasmodium ovale wallikeri]SBT41058.1 hypothetical protein POVWA2_041150 [Plasmodium ovale wallikeri]
MVKDKIESTDDPSAGCSAEEAYREGGRYNPIRVYRKKAVNPPATTYSERQFFDYNGVHFYITCMKAVQRCQSPNKGSTTKNGERRRSGVPTPLLQPDWRGGRESSFLE